MTGSIAIIGLGNMGVPIAARLIDAGHEVHGFDLAESARDRLAAEGGRAHLTAAEAAEGREIVVLMLPDSNVVEGVIAELLAENALSSGTLVLDMSSSEPVRTRSLHKRLDSLGISLADAPVSGGVKGAVEGRLAIMLGADDEWRAPLIELLQPLGKVIPSGAVGAGHAVKALNNLLSATHLWVTSEAIEAGRGFGLDTQVMLEVFNSSSGRSGSTENKWPNFILPETYDSGFALRLMLKDMQIAARLADEVGKPSILGQKAVQLWSAAAQDSEASADHTRVAEWIAGQSEEGSIENDG